MVSRSAVVSSLVPRSIVQQRGVQRRIALGGGVVVRVGGIAVRRRDPGQDLRRDRLRGGAAHREPDDVVGLLVQQRRAGVDDRADQPVGAVRRREASECCHPLYLQMVSSCGRSVRRSTPRVGDHHRFGHFVAPAVRPHAEDDVERHARGELRWSPRPQADGALTPVGRVADADRVADAATPSPCRAVG